ncbi:MAG: cardiolipin synthase ClsB [Gallionella sp.]|jgi:cardiolipin synthase|nr:cardiolipin synthase ClsB [Gallionella sp.]
MTIEHLVAGNRLRLLRNGEEYFPALLASIGTAEHSVYLETYIFETDETGHQFRQALSAAAARGVVVRVMLDGFGSAHFPQSWVDDLRAAGVDVLWFRRKISPLTLKRSRLRRLHRKLVSIDGEIAFIGGINIINDATAGAQPGVPRLDYAVRIEGTLAGDVQAAMRRLWGMVSWALSHHHGRRWRWHDRVGRAEDELSLVLRDNVRHRRDIERAYLKAMSGAQHEIILANAYFLPGRVFRRTLKQARQRGVRVILLLQGKVEYRLQHYATHALYDHLLDAEIEIYEYQPSFLHAKVAVVDGRWATVGSSNIDPFSLLLSREANLVVRDTAFAGELRTNLMQAIDRDARRIGKKDSGWITRLLAHISYGFVRFLVGLAGFPGKH